MPRPVLAESMKETNMSLSIDPKSDFVRRHVGPGKSETQEMLEFLGYSEMEELVQDTLRSRTGSSGPTSGSVTTTRSCPG